LPTSRTPVWFMRQAGRSLPEYRAIRGEGSILDAIKVPDLSTEITLQPVRRYGVDAALLYSDIVVPGHPTGFGVALAPGLAPGSPGAPAAPGRRCGVAAAILYSDIVVPVHAIGFGVDIAPGVGPVVERPFER